MAGRSLPLSEDVDTPTSEYALKQHQPRQGRRGAQTVRPHQLPLPVDVEQQETIQLPSRGTIREQFGWFICAAHLFGVEELPADDRVGLHEVPTGRQRGITSQLLQHLVW